MDAKDWTPEEHISELQRTLRARNTFTALLLIFSVVSASLSISPLENGSIFYALTFQVVSGILFLYAAHTIFKTLEYKQHMLSLIEKQENDLKLESVRMLAQIEVKLGESDRND